MHWHNTKGAYADGPLFIRQCTQIRRLLTAILWRLAGERLTIRSGGS